MRRATRHGGFGSLLLASFLCFLMGSGLAWAHDETATDATTAQALETIHPLTLQLLKLADSLGHAAPAARQAAFDALRAAIEARRQALLLLMETHPDKVLEAALPDGVRRSLPAALQSHIEHTVTLEGTFERLVADDFEHGISTVFNILNTDAGERITLHFDGGDPSLESGSRVRVHGVMLDDQLALAAPTNSSTTTTSSVETLAAPAVAPSTIKKVAVFLANIACDPNDPNLKHPCPTVSPFTPAYAKEQTFTNTTSANAHYQEATFGKWALQGKYNVDGDVYGWYTIPSKYYNTDGTLSCDSATTTCCISDWEKAAKAAASAELAAAGKDLTGYNSLIYMLPAPHCGTAWGGYAVEVYSSSYFRSNVLAHELGHTYSLGHAGSYSCYTDSTKQQRVAMGAYCEVTAPSSSGQYGDPLDIMGYTMNRDFHGFHKARLGYNATATPYGLFNPGNVYDVPLGASGLYEMVPIHEASSAIKVLRIPRDVNSTGGVSKYYYLEFRQPYGSFDNFSASDPAVNGVSIRLAPPHTAYGVGYIIDTTPGTTSFSDAPLAVGKTFEDPIKGITITTTAIDKTVFPPVARVNISFGPIVCTLASPSVSLSPSRQDGYAGQTLTYTLTLTNNNTSVCPSATFNVVPSLPVGWLQSPATLSLSVASGASVTQSLSITSSADATLADNPVTETATNTAAATSTASASATYYVLPPDTTAPSVTITKPANGATLKGTAVTIAASASDASGISRMELFVDSTSVKVCLNTTSCSVRYSTSTLAAGSHTVTATATDKASTPNTGSTSITVIK